MHPKERRSTFAGTRRDFLARTGGAALAATGGVSLLAACSDNSQQAVSTGASGKLLGPGFQRQQQQESLHRSSPWEPRPSGQHVTAITPIAIRAV